MAVLTRYVWANGSTSGGNGTADTGTGANRAYVSLNACIAAEGTDLVTDGDSLVIVCKIGSGGSTADSTLVTLSGFTTGASNDITIQGEISGAKWDATLYRLEGAEDYDPMILFQENYVTVENFQLYNTNASGYAEGVSFTIAGNSDIAFKQCIIRGGDGTNNDGWCEDDDTSGVGTGTHTWTMENCILYDWTNGIYFGYAGGTNVFNLANNTIADIGAGNGIFLRYNGTQTVNAYNNLITDTGGNCYNFDASNTLNSGNNISDDTSSPDTSFRSKTITYTNQGGDDYSYAASETDAADAGVGPASQSEVPDTSYNGEARSGTTTDIGAHQIAAAGGANPRGPLGMPLHGPLGGPI